MLTTEKNSTIPKEAVYVRVEHSLWISEYTFYKNEHVYVDLHFTDIKLCVISVCLDNLSLIAVLCQVNYGIACFLFFIWNKKMTV